MVAFCSPALCSRHHQRRTWDASCSTAQTVSSFVQHLFMKATGERCHLLLKAPCLWHRPRAQQQYYSQTACSMSAQRNAIPGIRFRCMQQVKRARGGVITCCPLRHCRGSHQRQQHLQPRGMQQVWDQALNLAAQPEHSGHQLLSHSDCCNSHHDPEQLTGHEVPGQVCLDGVMPWKPAEHGSCRSEQYLQQAA